MQSTTLSPTRNRSYLLGLPLIIGAVLIILMTRFLNVQAAEPQEVLFVNLIHVNTNVVGGTGSGDSWANAMPSLQTALTSAISGDQIWVATGVYTPGIARTDSFTLVAGVEMYGGFDPSSAINEFDERDWDAYPTVLSGDIDGNDITDTNGVVTDTANLSVSSNSYHVVTSTNVLSSTVLDGFIITAGDADGSSPINLGGGMHIASSSPTLVNLTFSGNSAYSGGGMHNVNSSPTLTNVTFTSNTATNAGGGMQNQISAPVLTNVTFDGNSANEGGGIWNKYGTPKQTNVTFVGNSATRGGGIYAKFNFSPNMANVTFAGNSANEGGGMYIKVNSNPILTNVTFSGNSATNNGGGMWIGITTKPSLANVTFAANSATNSGGGIYNNPDSNSPVIRNTIFWTNTAGITSTAAISSSVGSIVSLTNNLVQGGCPVGASCSVTLTDDPLFVRDPDSGDGNWATLADNDYGNLRLRVNSPAINQGNNSFIAGVTTDLDGNPRIIDSLVDLGAFENQNPDGNACFVEDADADSLTDYASADASAVQEAINAANSGDILKIAGTCVGVTVTGGMSQTAYINSNLTLMGAYTYTDWTTQQLGVYTTTLDADQSR